MAVKFSNNAVTTLSASVSNSATSLSVSSASAFPSLGAGDYTYVTLIDASDSSVFEIVKVTAISGTTFTVTRAQQSTTAIAFDSGDKVELRVTASLLEEAIDESDYTVTQSDVTAHQAALSITESQISDLGSYLPSASYTAADVLTKIKTVDGSGSDLDADKLDGQHGSHYLDYNNFSNTPTVPSNNNQLTNGAGYITGYTVTESDVTGHQAALSITESQISDLGTYIESGDTVASLTITSADLNGGSIDGTTIGANTAAAGSFTTVTASGDITAYSDARLKTDIHTLDGSIAFRMRGVEFKKDGRLSSGVIAQELEQVAPELVFDDGEFKTVAYGNLVGYLIEAIKGLKKEIEELKEER